MENRLTGVSADKPHPLSYRPDLPLRSELLDDPFLEDIREEGYDEGYRDAKAEYGRRVAT